MKNRYIPAFIMLAAGTGTDDPPVSLVSEAELGWNQSAADRALLLCYSGFLRLYDDKLY